MKIQTSQNIALSPNVVLKWAIDRYMAREARSKAGKRKLNYWGVCVGGGGGFDRKHRINPFCVMRWNLFRHTSRGRDCGSRFFPIAFFCKLHGNGRKCILSLGCFGFFYEWKCTIFLVLKLYNTVSLYLIVMQWIVWIQCMLLDISKVFHT